MGKTKVKFRFDSCERVTKPNYRVLAKLVKKAKGNRTSAAFAEVCNTSSSTMSRFMNGTSISAMSDALILAIAKNADADSGVTLELLQEANGLFAKSYKDSDAKCLYNKCKTVSERLVREIIQNGLLKSGFAVALKSDAGSAFEIETNAFLESNLTTWSLDVLFSNSHIADEDLVYEKMNKILATNYLKNRDSKVTKRSLVTDNKGVFEFIKEVFGKEEIPNVVSAVLVDIAERKVVDEYQIPMVDNA